VTFSMAIADSITENVPATLRVRACPLLDVACNNPTTEPTSPDPDGVVRLSLPLRFEGFLEIQSEETIPALFFISTPLRPDTQAEALPLISEMGIVALAQSNDAPIDLEQTGVIVIRTYDCQDRSASGVSLSSAGEGQVFMFVQGLPQVGIEETDEDGLGGF